MQGWGCGGVKFNQKTNTVATILFSIRYLCLRNINLKERGGGEWGGRRKKEKEVKEKEKEKENPLRAQDVISDIPKIWVINHPSLPKATHSRKLLGPGHGLINVPK